MSNKIVIYFFALLLIYSGVITIIDPYVHRGSFFGFATIPRGGNVDSVKWILGLLLICMGCILLFTEYKKSKIPHMPTTKCPKCKEVFEYKDTLEGKCPHCKDVDTIELKEYYKKYPDEKKSDL